MIWLAWERVYFRLKIFLFRKSILWNVIKKERVCANKTDNWKQEESSIKRKKILLKACVTIGTPQHSKDENYNVFLWELWLKGKLKNSHIHIKENDLWEKEDCFY
jgi:hypothetical protein